MNLVFREDISRDIYNWRTAVSTETYGVDWKMYLPASLSIDQVMNEQFLKVYLDREYYCSGKVAEFRIWLETHADSNQIVADLEALTGKQFIPGPVTCFITTFHCAPYNVDRRLFYSIWRSTKREHAITSIYHEMMHFLFHWFYWDECRKAGLTDAQIHAFKESLTVLLNPTLEIRGLPSDRGYTTHAGLRAKWEAMRAEEEGFDTFFHKALAEYRVYGA